MPWGRGMQFMFPIMSLNKGPDPEIVEQLWASGNSCHIEESQLRGRRWEETWLTFLHYYLQGCLLGIVRKPRSEWIPGAHWAHTVKEGWKYLSCKVICLLLSQPTFTIRWQNTYITSPGHISNSEKGRTIRISINFELFVSGAGYLKPRESDKTQNGLMQPRS